MSENSLLYKDGEGDSEGGSGAALSDEFYPHVSVDERTGRTWVSFYSSRLDESRKTTNVYVRELTRKGDGIGLAPLTRVSNAIDLSEGDSLGFYYGDYAGLDVVGGWPYPSGSETGLSASCFSSVASSGMSWWPAATPITNS